MYYKLLTHKYMKIVIAFILFFFSYKFIILYKNIYIGYFFLIFSLSIIFFYFKNEFLIISFFTIRNGNINSTKKWLSYIKNYNTQLTKNQISYFFFLKGLTNINSDLKKSEYYLVNSLKLGLKFKYNKALAMLNLATIAISKGKKREAENILLEVKKIDKIGIMHEQIKFIKNQIKKINISTNIKNPIIRKKINFFIKKN